MMKNETYEFKMETNDRITWKTFKLVFTRLLGNQRDQNYRTNAIVILENFSILECNINLKVHNFH